MIANAHEYRITRERVDQFRAHLQDPNLSSSARGGAESMLADLEREIALWEAGIREPVPGNSDLVSPPWTLEQVNAMSDEDYERTSLQAGILLKQAEIANIDRQIGIVLDRIADWRRHRAWLEREISELTAATDRQPAASRA